MKYVSPAYETQLIKLAELLVTPERYQTVGAIVMEEMFPELEAV